MSNPLSRPTPADLNVRLAGTLAVVEPLSAEHEPGLLAAAEDAAMFTWMPVDMTSPAALRAWLRTALTAAQAGREVPFAIRDARSGEVVGSTRFLELRLEHLRAEIGWTWVRRSSWSTGINVEGKLLLLGRAFDHVGLRRVEFKTDARNERSRGALTALGAAFEGVLRKHMVRSDGSPRDSAYFSVIDSDWDELRERLTRRVATQVDQ
ncbi:MAG: N-acetyltransferase [Solirubrobacteraceae bacterium]|nr:N-acetyltransferase [Solirubrobacteraceae bacterium]